jgi:thiamine-phosphate pyrophosphorylase
MMVRCYITDRKLLAPGMTLVNAIARAMGNGANWIQIREKDLSSRALYEVTVQAVAMAAPMGIKILVNSRLDIALAAGAAGVHLPGGSPSPKNWRAIAPPGFLIGTSCHTLAELRAAQDEGADYAVFGPVFPPRSKVSDLAPRGLVGLERAVRAVNIPILALGGVTHDNAEECTAAGAAGVAAISFFQDGGRQVYPFQAS